MFGFRKRKKEPLKRESFDTFLSRLTVENPAASLEDALKAYIAEHNLAARHQIDEAPAVVDVRTKLQILEGSSLSDPMLHPDKALQDYIEGLRFFMRVYRPPPQFGVKERSEPARPDNGD